jgi:hypothetical protein
MEYKVNTQIYKRIKLKYNEMTEKEQNTLFDSMSWFFLPDGVKKRVRYKIQDKLKTIDKLSILFAFIGTVSNIFSSFLYIDFKKHETIDSNIH